MLSTAALYDELAKLSKEHQAGKRINSLGRIGHTKAQNIAYREAIAALEYRWRQWLGEEYAHDFPSQARSIIFTRSWDDGHSSGYHEVVCHYRENCDFARAIIRATT